jgi:di/tricarboxylate transporter
VVLMASFWATEALPLAVTSLIPIVLLPILGKEQSFQLLYYQ